MFDTVLDKIEYELNQNDINLTDGFYSSDEEDENMKESKPREFVDSFSSDTESIDNLKLLNIEEQKGDQEDLRNWYPELDINPLDKGEPLPTNPEITHRMAACINFSAETLSLASGALSLIKHRKELGQEHFETNRNTTGEDDNDQDMTQENNAQSKGTTQIEILPNI